MHKQNAWLKYILEILAKFRPSKFRLPYVKMQ